MRSETLDIRREKECHCGLVPQSPENFIHQLGMPECRKAIIRHDRIVVLFLFLLFTSFSAIAQGSFTASLDKKKLSVNGTFQITFTLTNADGKNFTPPSFSEFNVLSGPNQATSMQYINGSMSRSISFSYYLKPNKEGTFTIAPASIVVGGKSISSNSVMVEVTKADAKEKTQQSGEQDIYSQISDNVFLRLIVDKKEVSQGEQITATYKLYYRATMGNTSIIEAPSYTGFWTQELDVPENAQFSSEVYDGVQFNVSIVKRDALFPQRGGELQVEPMELQTYVRVQTNNRGFFSTYQDYPYKFKSNSVKINVKPLPTAGVPLSFNGAVGDYTMEVTLDKTVTKPDEPVTLTVNVTGIGNIKMLDVPKINLPADLETFDPKSSEKISKKNNIISGSKSYEYLIIPRRGGQFKIPPVEFSYFDLSKQEYVTQQSPEYIINVEGESTASSTPSITGINKEEVELLGEDIRYIKTGEANLKKNNDYFLTSWMFGGMYATPFLLFALLFAYKRREEKFLGNAALLKNRRANKEATKRLKQAKKYLGEQNRKAFYDEITRAIWGYLGDKLSINQSALSREQIQLTLTEKKITPEIIQLVFKTLDASEMALFSPVSDGEMNKAYDDAGEIISKLDAEL